MTLTWKDFKEIVETAGVKDSDVIRIIDSDDNSIEDTEDLKESIESYSSDTCNMWEILV